MRIQRYNVDILLPFIALSKNLNLTLLKFRMKQKIIITTLFLILFTDLIAQDTYYYYKGKKTNISLSEQSSRKNKVSYSINLSNNKSLNISDIFYIKLKKENDLKLLRAVAKKNNAVIVHQNKFMPLWYKLKLLSNANKSSVEISNEFYETGNFANVDPAFIFNFNESSTNDSNFADLWGLQNSTNPDVDINACDAWTITQGEGVNVAVLDTGIDIAHDDINDNVSPLSYDTQSASSPAIFKGNHGMHVSGIIAAEKDNNLQVVGVAPKSKLISLSHDFSVSPSISEEMANGINWAVQNGADIINNSWGDQGGIFYNNLHSALLEDAIINAIKNGRNGLGTILVFCSGNRAPNIDYPGNFHDDALVVGSINSSGVKAESSAYGSDLDIVAPGVEILSTVTGQRIDSRSGTSMAAPHVSGIAALILSINPSLTVKEVNTIIESTAQKLENYTYDNNQGRPYGTWNEEVGYGLVDAYAAVKMAKEYNALTLDDINIVCYDTEKLINLKNNHNSSIQWKASSNVTIISSTNNSVKIKAATSTSYGKGWVRAIINDGAILQEDFEVGTPQYDQGKIEIHPRHENSSNLLLKKWTRIRLTKAWPYQRKNDWEWNVEHSMVKPSTSKGIAIRPLKLRSIEIKARRKNECGCGAWISNSFEVK